MKKKMMTSLFLCVLAALLILMVGGCGRKHIVSSPPAQQPAKQAEAKKPSKPEAAQDKPGLIEDTYVVDAPEETAPSATIKEGELEEEPLGIPTTTDATAAAGAGTAAAVSKAETAESEPEVKAATQGEIYYVQIGAFSDLENANRALARLLSDGYEGSRLSKTEDGLFRVQAGTFPDEASAGETLSKLLAAYPKGFVLKQD